MMGDLCCYTGIVPAIRLSIELGGTEDIMNLHAYILVDHRVIKYSRWYMNSESMKKIYSCRLAQGLSLYSEMDRFIS